MSEPKAPTVAEITHALRTAEGARLVALVRRWGEDQRPGVVAAVESAQVRVDKYKSERQRIRQLYLMEDTLRDAGVLFAAGVDEVGRGALAGPVTAAACILPQKPRIDGLDDSKKLTPQRREELDSVIRQVAVCWSVAHVAPHQIDQMGMTAALRLAMTQALSGLSRTPQHVLIDGRPMGVAVQETAVIKGDSIVAAIAAASIVAKVARDSLMRELSQEHCVYGFDVNKGYGTTDHMDAIAAHGLSPLHRRSFCRSITDPRLF